MDNAHRPRISRLLKQGLAKQFIVYDFNRDKFIAELDRESENNTLRNIVDFLDSSPQRCRTIVAEKRYIDEDYRDEYSAFYSKTFKHHSARCTRFHFFSKKIIGQNISRLEKYSKHYLGFMVWRPTGRQAVGRTILKPKIGRKQYLHCLADFEAHIQGLCLNIRAMPFIQQDTRVGACAHAALWMAARYMSRRFGDREFSPSQINFLAKKSYSSGRLYPADCGLNVQQVLNALESMGFSSEFYPIEEMPLAPEELTDHPSERIDAAFRKRKINWGRRGEAGFVKSIKLADVAYRYIESGLPVLFITDDHAFVAIGHELSKKTKVSLSIERLPSFLTNNDNTGPYQKVPIWEVREEPLKEDGRYIFYDVTGVLAIMPHEVSLRGEEAEITAELVLSSYFAEKRNFKFLSPILYGRADLNRLWHGEHLLRTFLIRSVEWQRHVRAQLNSNELHKDICEILLRLDYPKYIWVTEITSDRAISDESDNSRCCLGYAIVDSTAQPETASVLAALFMDVLVVFNHDNMDGEFRRTSAGREKEIFYQKNCTPVRQLPMGRTLKEKDRGYGL